MGELQAVSEISPFTAIIWCLYPIGILVLAELVLRTNDDDDDDFQGGKGVREQHNQPMHHQEHNGFLSPILEVR